VAGWRAGTLAIWVRSERRRRRASLLALAVLCGLAFGVAATAVAGARRTASSFDRLRRVTEAYDVGIAIDAPGSSPDAPAHDHYDDATIRRIEALPQLARYTTATAYIASSSPDWEFALYAPEDATLGDGIEKARLLRGRVPASDRADEVAINEAAVDQAHVDIGSVLHLKTLSPAQRMQMLTGDRHAFDHGFRGPELALKVVGVARGTADVVGRPSPSMFATEAFDRTYRGRVAYSTRLILARWAPGVTADQFETALHRITNNRLGDFAAATEDRPARNAAGALADGLWVFALVAAMASIVTVGFAVSRHAAFAEADQYALTSLGFTRSQRVGGIVAGAAPIALGGAALAVLVSFAASALMPVGIAHRIEPDPGVQLDSTVAVAVFVVVIVVVAFAATLGALAATRRAAARSRAQRAPALASSLAAGGTPPVVTTGVRLAFDRRPPALPVRSALVGVGAAVVVAVASMTFAASLDRLATHPARWGYGWDLQLDASPDNMARVVHELGANPDLAGVGIFSSNFTEIDGTGTRAYGLEDTRGAIGYALRSGKQPVAADEVVIGPRTARLDHLQVGDTVRLAVCPCGREGAKVRTSAVRVVGVALFPEDDAGNFDDALGFSGAGFARHVPEGDPPRLAVQLAPRRNLETVAAALAERYPGQLSRYSYPTRPGDVENLTDLRRFPIALALFTALLGLAALANVLVTTTRRRRAEFATLRTMGLTPRQTYTCVMWQSLSVAIAALIVGVPVGIVLGARFWAAVSSRVDVATDAARPLAALLVMTGAALLVAAGAGLTIGSRAARIRPAEALRRE
jgi:hypothetical protein